MRNKFDLFKWSILWQPYLTKKEMQEIKHHYLTCIYLSIYPFIDLQYIVYVSMNVCMYVCIFVFSWITKVLKLLVNTFPIYG